MALRRGLKRQNDDCGTLVCRQVAHVRVLYRFAAVISVAAASACSRAWIVGVGRSSMRRARRVLFFRQSPLSKGQSCISPFAAV
jgi:hypothetical protein